MGLLGSALGGIAKGIAADAAVTAAGVAAGAASSAVKKLETVLESHESKIDKALKRNPANCKMVVKVDLRLKYKRSGKYTVDSRYTVQDDNGNTVLRVSESIPFGEAGLVISDSAGRHVGQISKKGGLASLSPFRTVYSVGLLGSAPFELRSLAFKEREDVNGDAGSRFRALYSLSHNGWQYGCYLSFSRDDEVRDADGRVVAQVPWFHNSLSRTYVIDYPNADEGLLCAVFALVQCMEFCESRRADGRMAGSGGGA